MMHIKARKGKPVTAELPVEELERVGFFHHLEGKSG